jgi:hypothetical protein
MTVLVEVPLSADSALFPITLGGVRLFLRFIWRNAGGAGWVMDVLDDGQVDMVTGLPLVTGLDLLSQHKHLGIPGELWVMTDADRDAVPTYTNLGTDSHLLFYQP